MSKQDRQGVRTAADIERKYALGEVKQRFKEVREWKPITIKDITESTDSDGLNKVVFSDGSTLEVRNGHSPERGVDYYTEGDVEEMVGAVLEKVLESSDGTYVSFGKEKKEVLYTAPDGWMYYGETLLPQIPVVEGYDYAWIRENGDVYDLLLCDTQCSYGEGVITTGSALWYTTSIEPTEWSEQANNKTTWEVEAVLWSNHDITSSGDVWCSGSEAVSEYIETVVETAERDDAYVMYAEDLNELAAIVQMLTNTEELMNIKDIIACLQAMI